MAVPGGGTNKWTSEILSIYIHIYVIYLYNKNENHNANSYNNTDNNSDIIASTICMYGAWKDSVGFCGEDARFGFVVASCQGLCDQPDKSSAGSCIQHGSAQPGVLFGPWAVPRGASEHGVHAGI